MTYGRQTGRRQPRDHDPVTVSEVARWQERHEQDSDATHRDLRRLIEILDERTDKLTVRIAVIFGVATALWSVLLAIAPFIRGVLGLPNG